MSQVKPDASPVELAWDEAAHGYDGYFSPRFAPYLAAGLGALIGRTSDLPGDGCIVVPCVGPGRELAPLAHSFPERRIVASDLSGEMVKLAQERNRRFANVSVERDDATQLRMPALAVSALFSVFGLQLLPNPADTLGSWLRLLSPKGLALVVYWSRERETDEGGPFDTMHRLLAETLTVDRRWEHRLEECARAASAHVRENVGIAFEIQHQDARSCWQALTGLGPLRALAVARGPAFVAELGRRFEAQFAPGPLSHTPEARLLLIQRDDTVS